MQVVSGTHLTPINGYYPPTPTPTPPRGLVHIYELTRLKNYSFESLAYLSRTFAGQKIK